MFGFKKFIQTLTLADAGWSGTIRERKTFEPVAKKITLKPNPCLNEDKLYIVSSSRFTRDLLLTISSEKEEGLTKTKIWEALKNYLKAIQKGQRL